MYFLLVILINSVFGINYYPQMFLEECNYEMKMSNYITGDAKNSSYENVDEENSDKENSDEENSNKENFDAGF